MTHEIHQKWGFGMAPPKPKVQAERQEAAKIVLAFADTYSLAADLPEALSTIKGLFSRVCRQDQWDWFATSSTLGYPSARMAAVIASTVGAARRASVMQDEDALRDHWALLRRLPFRACLQILVGTARVAEAEGAGWVYLLSTREVPDLLKIGMTLRTVEERAKEINGATGVAFPFGVRRCWRTRDPATAERLIHQALAEHRIRADREFFRAPFRLAATIIDEALNANQLELRTLNNLAVVPNS